MKATWKLVVGFLLIGLSASAYAEKQSDKEAEQLLKDLRQRLEGIKTVQADFVQEKNLKVFQHTLVIRGKFAVERPKRLIWHVTDPVKYSISVAGDDVRFWDEDTNKVNTIHIGPSHNFRAVFEQFQGWFLGDYRSLEESYAVVVEEKDPLTVSFGPKANSPMAKMIKGVTVVFKAESAYLDSLTINEGSGDATHIRFLNTKVNQPIANEIWEIPPK